MNRELNRLFNLMSLEADGKGGTGGSDDNNSGDDKGNENKTYSQAELDALLQSEADKRVSEALKKAEKKKTEAVKEAEKLAKMNSDEQFKYQLEQREKAIADKEAQLALMENKNEASKILSEKGISLELVNFIVADDADTMMANINVLDKAFKASVKAEVEKRLGSKTPKSNLPLDGALTKETFSKMSIKEQQQLYVNNKELYESLTK